MPERTVRQGKYKSPDTNTSPAADTLALRTELYNL